MSTQEISIPYKSKAQTALYIATLMMSPVWAVLCPIAIVISATGLVVGGIIQSVALALETMSGSSPIGAILATMLGAITSIPYLCLALAVAYIGMVSFFIFGDSDVTLNEDGICFPGIFMFRLSFKRERKWEQLKSISLVSTGKKAELEFRFSPSGVARLKIPEKRSADLEQLLLALEVWAKPHIQDPIFLNKLDELHNKRTQIGQASYTEIWENEVNRRFSSTAFVPLEPGSKLQNDRLVVTRQIAFGGLSAIYLAQSRETELVLLKESVLADLAGEKVNEAHKFFEREARLLMKLQHPQIARVLDFFVEQDRSYIVLEYKRGSDLRQLVKHGGAQPAETVIEWGIQLADILIYIHGAEPPVIHRDLTPDNIVANKDILTLIDFGAANEYLGTATGTLVGKQAYISPEQFRGKACTASDIYALGCTLYFLLTGQDPEPLSTSSPRQIDQTLPDELDRIIQACTAFAVEDRLKNAQEVKEELVKIKNLCSPAK